jgi:hypothetical protein
MPIQSGFETIRLAVRCAQPENYFIMLIFAVLWDFRFMIKKTGGTKV